MITLDNIKGVISIGNASILSFYLQGNIGSETKVIIKGIKVFQFHMRFLDCKDSNLRLSGINANLFSELEKQERFLPDNLLGKTKNRIRLFDKKSLLDISYSSMGKALIDALDLTTFDKVIIYDSIVSEVNWSNIIWPLHIDSYSLYESEKFYARFNDGFIQDRSEIRRRRENYRQLKFAMNKQNDFIGEQFFHGLEMKAYDKSLLWKKDFWTKLILKFSFWSSNYGQSFVRPILSLSIVNGLLFWLLYLTGQSKFHSYNLSKWNFYVETLAEFLRLANPLHKNEPELTGLAFILDTLMRIFASYFLYNIIRATRRFVR